MQIVAIITIFIQIAAAIIAVSYIRKTMDTTWIFIGGALLLMGLRSLLIVFGYTITSLESSLVALLISVLILSGVFFIPRIFAQYNQNITHLKSLQEIDRAMLSSLSHKGIMNAIIDKLNSALDTDAIAILTVNKNNTFDTFVSHNLNKELEQRIVSDNSGYVSWVIDNRKPLIISQITDDDKEDFLKALRTEGFFSYMCSPVIMKGGTPTGVLTLYSKSPRRFTSREIKFVGAISSQIAIALDRAHLVERIKEMGVESIRALVEAIELRDPYTHGHAYTVAELLVQLGKAMGLTERELILINYAGLLHDVGKISIPEGILLKKSALTDSEWEIIKKHPAHSAQIIEPIRNLRYITNWVLCHHERWDGTGYPLGKKREEIPLQARMLAVCDTYSAMTASRPYRGAFTIEETKVEIERVAGTQLDPAIAHIFLTLDFGEVRKKINNSSTGV
jgi:response regulator RpfG family c-di-GMP phosphodiesterase